MSLLKGELVGFPKDEDDLMTADSLYVSVELRHLHEIPQALYRQLVYPTIPSRNTALYLSLGG